MSDPNRNMEENTKSGIKTKWWGAMCTPQCCGCSIKYVVSIPGLLRLLNIALGFICLGLWLPGYEDEFTGQRINSNGETDRGYGIGWKREALNQFVLAAILISLATSIAVLVGIVVVRNAANDWVRLNKFVHLFVFVLLFMGSVAGACGVWYFNENCCHVEMEVDMTGLMFSLAAKENNYFRHCHCYLTRYLNLGDKFVPSAKETMLYDALRHPDVSQFNQRWSFSAHHLSQHVATIFIMSLNDIIYLLGSRFTNPRRNQKISMT
ncbi:uncharacterized protein LOC118436264 [Folsomia candida]|uniref:Uncharacterized protein n=1 Tax=Folsomia candida TaxID=158441 RepID=A0A226E355_FOLCA|nr:uncharacterized protein LOC118436264 [Folsomia candida]OXA51869.1 hypothetical protein Fcan01_13009 [Folsomia candida]